MCESHWFAHPVRMPTCFSFPDVESSHHQGGIMSGTAPVKKRKESDKDSDDAAPNADAGQRKRRDLVSRWRHFKRRVCAPQFPRLEPWVAGHVEQGVCARAPSKGCLRHCCMPGWRGVSGQVGDADQNNFAAGKDGGRRVCCCPGAKGEIAGPRAGATANT